MKMGLSVCVGVCCRRKLHVKVAVAHAPDKYDVFGVTVVDINKVKIVTNAVRDPNTVNYAKVAPAGAFGMQNKPMGFQRSVVAQKRAR